LENAPIAKFLQHNKETLDLLVKLKTKYKFIDLITGSNQKNASAKLSKLKIPEEIFSNTITADNGSKSDLSAFYLWVSFYPDYKLENFLYIGDRVSSDYEKPKEFGIQSILVNIKNSEPDIECLQLNDLLSVRDYLL
jgi:FMN phosphatase YigB (HAD superfamily)